MDSDDGSKPGACISKITTPRRIVVVGTRSPCHMADQEDEPDGNGVHDPDPHMTMHSSARAACRERSASTRAEAQRVIVRAPRPTPGQGRDAAASDTRPPRL